MDSRFKTRLMGPVKHRLLHHFERIRNGGNHILRQETFGVR